MSGVLLNPTHRGTNHDDPRNDLFLNFAHYVDYFRPRAFVLENVVGLATQKDGSTLKAMQEAFGAVGYESDWRILNAAQYGVPQKRERLVMLGVERGGSLEFPRPTHGGDSIGRTIGYRERDRMHGCPSNRSLFDDEAADQAALLPVVSVADAIDDLPTVGSGECSSVPRQPGRRSCSSASGRPSTTAGTPTRAPSRSSSPSLPDGHRRRSWSSAARSRWGPANGWPRGRDPGHVAVLHRPGVPAPGRGARRLPAAEPGGHRLPA